MPYRTLPASHCPAISVQAQKFDAACVLYRSLSAPAPAVTEAEDSDGRRWALKRIAGSDQLAREADRLAKLQGHPLIVPLQSIFVEGGVTYLQMPFYPKGNLRIWVEQVKVISSRPASLPVVHMQSAWLMHLLSHMLFLQCITIPLTSTLQTMAAT